jgi:hypothetical protein
MSALDELMLHIGKSMGEFMSYVVLIAFFPIVIVLMLTRINKYLKKNLEPVRVLAKIAMRELMTGDLDSAKSTISGLKSFSLTMSLFGMRLYAKALEAHLVMFKGYSDLAVNKYLYYKGSIVRNTGETWESLIEQHYSEFERRGIYYETMKRVRDKFRTNNL